MFGRLVSSIPRYVRLARSQWWSPERLHAYQNAELEQTLRAAAAIPFYAERFGDRPWARELESLPILKRGDVPALNRSVRALYPAPKEFVFGRSSGTTGFRIEVIFDPAHQRGRFAARARYLTANGWNPMLRSAWILGLRPGATPDWNLTQTRFIGGARFASHIDPFNDQVAWLEKTDPHFIYTLPSNVEGLLSSFAKQKKRLRSLRKIFTGGEVLEAHVREQVRQVLGVDIADNYGSSEIFFGWQCPSGRYHLNAEHVLVELVDEQGRRAAPGRMGKVLATTLENHLMPLVRYEVEDYAIAGEGRCPCGRGLPLIGEIIGRGVNLFRLPGGELLSPWKAVEVLKQMGDVRQVQIVQQALDRYVVRFAADDPVSGEVEASIRRDFNALVGAPVSLGFERLEEIPRAPSGKFMSTVCEIGRESGGAE